MIVFETILIMLLVAVLLLALAHRLRVLPVLLALAGAAVAVASTYSVWILAERAGLSPFQTYQPRLALV
jgi:hypothetical protein